MNPLTPSNFVKGEDRDKFMEELERDRIASSLERHRQQVIIRREEWVREARKEVVAREEFKKTMDIFPDLVWEAILERVGDSNDKALMSNMTEMWWKLCKEERIKFLFEGVFSILHSNGYLSATNDMLSCRLVCKEWKRSIDDYLQSSESKTDLDFLVPRPLPMLEIISHYTLSYINPDAAEMLNLRPPLDLSSVGLDYSGVNPFISRKVILGTPTPLFHHDLQGTAEFWDSADNLLEVWGRELWELTLCFNRGISAVILYLYIIYKLNHCPNLRYLRIICNEHGELDQGSNIGSEMKLVREMGQDIYEALLERIEANPPPDLPYLKSIQTTFVPAPIIHAMAKKYGGNLESICGGAFEANATEYVQDCVLPQLKEFKSFYFAPDTDQGPLIFTAEWPNLKELALLFENVRERNISRLFESINRFSSAGLRKLILHLHKEDGAMTKLPKNVIKQLSLELSELEVMTLSVCRINLSSIDFLLPLAKLKELNLIYVKHVASLEGKAGNANKKTPTSKTNSDELIKFSEYINRLYESNIWRVFPDLKVVRIGVVKILIAEGKIGKRCGGIPTEQGRLMQVRDVSGMLWDNVEGVHLVTKRKIYTRDGYESHQNASDKH